MIGAAFAVLGAARDSGGTRFFLQVAAGPKGGDEWDATVRPLRETQRRLRAFFAPLLGRIKVYALIPPPRPVPAG